VANGVSNNCSSDNLHNVLFSGCGAAILAGGLCMTVAGEQVTADVTNFWAANGAPGDVTLSILLTNSIVAGNLGSVPVLGTGHVVINPATAFQTVDTGNHYLAANSPYRNAGTTNISPQLLAELRQKTTYPPASFPPVTPIGRRLDAVPAGAALHQRRAGRLPD
jgi:hypothetical protein